jgi:hypothetical protein
MPGQYIVLYKFMGAFVHRMVSIFLGLKLVSYGA